MNHAISRDGSQSRFNKRPSKIRMNLMDFATYGQNNLGETGQINQMNQQLPSTFGAKSYRNQQNFLNASLKVDNKKQLLGQQKRDELLRQTPNLSRNHDLDHLKSSNLHNLNTHQNTRNQVNLGGGYRTKLEKLQSHDRSKRDELQQLAKTPNFDEKNQLMIRASMPHSTQSRLHTLNDAHSAGNSPRYVGYMVSKPRI